MSLPIIRALVLAAFLIAPLTSAFTHERSRCRSVFPRLSASSRPNIAASQLHQSLEDCPEIYPPIVRFRKVAVRAVATASLAATVAFSPLGETNSGVANAYEASDYASETVTAAVKSLKDAEGDKARSFQAFEDIGAIIAEGKGIGGKVDYNGVQLERGFVADEDTSIYNPGLSLLTESVKDRIVEGIVKNRKVGLAKKNAWSEENEAGFSQLKFLLDPLHMYELSGYLKILPFYGAAVYLVTFFIQQNFRGIFPVAYFVGALAVFAPIAALIFAGV